MTAREQFQAEFDKLGYQWSESNQEKAFLGWQLCSALAAAQPKGELTATAPARDGSEPGLQKPPSDLPELVVTRNGKVLTDQQRGIHEFLEAATPEQRAERNFCERCGKLLGDGVHTCTPPGVR